MAKTLRPPTEARARIMRSVRSTGNASTELKIASILRSVRLSGWRRHLPLPGRPDFAWPGLRVALFVDGCFWHGCPRCYQAPKRNRGFWAEKLSANALRDRRVSAKLRRAGWAVLRVWECQVNSDRTLHRLQSVLALADVVAAPV